MNGMYVVIIIMVIMCSIAIIFLWMHVHDQQIEIEQDIKSASCSYLRDFIIIQEQKYFKHPWYNLAIKKVNSVECTDNTVCDDTYTDSEGNLYCR